jgi:hypothetical protein
MEFIPQAYNLGASFSGFFVLPDWYLFYGVWHGISICEKLAQLNIFGYLV